MGHLGALRLLVLGILLHVAPQAIAQWDTLALPFRHLTTEDGLSQGMINSIIQDKYGFMWFATKDGLDRYDGYGFKAYRQDPADPGSLAENYVSVVREANDGRLWVGTSSRGVQVFDPRTEVFTSVPFGPDADASYILDIESDRHGNTWVSTSTGLFKYTTKSKVPADTICRVTKVFEGQCRIALDRSGHLWGYRKATTAFRITPRTDGPDLIDTLPVQPWAEGLWNENPQTHVNGLIAVDPWTGRVFGVHPFFIAEYDTITLEARVVHRMDYPSSVRLEAEDVVIDKQGGLWIGSNQCWRFDTRTRHMSRVLAQDPNLQGLMPYIGVSCQDRNGLLWLGTLGHGVLRYDPRFERFHTRSLGSVRWMRPAHGQRFIVQLREDVLRVFDPVEDRYTEAIDLADPRVSIKFPIPQDAVDAVVQDREGAYWMCKGDLVRFEPTRTRFDVFKVRPLEQVAQWHRNIFPLYMDGDVALCYGNNAIFQRFDRATGTTVDHPYPIPASFSTYSFLQAIHKDAQGIFWLGTLKGLLRLDSTGAWTHYHNDPVDPRSLGQDVIFTICADPREPDRYLWIGTNGGGLDRFDKATGECAHYTTNEGLPNNVVYGIVDDPQGHLWMSTNKGIAHFDPTTAKFRNYSASDGLQGDEFNRNAFGRTPDGLIFFGGVNGFNYFRPEELQDDSLEAVVRITGIKLINEPVTFHDPGSPLTEPVSLSQGMRIPYTANMVTFEFATMEFAAPEDHSYQYKLEGFDPDWLVAGNRNSATYTNLDPGSYTFRVRGDNRDGAWRGAGTTFTITVLPPWWRTWWAYSGAFLVVVGSVAIYIRSLRRQRVVLEETVQQRTHELTEAKARAEHSEQVKQQFLANMSHEIRTPMNAIMGMSAILDRNPHPPEQDKYLHAIVQSSGNLLVILNDILDLSKLEAGKISLESVPFDPRTVLGNVRDILQFKAEEKGLLLTLSIGAAVPPGLEGDPARLQQILINLAGNAIKFTDAGSVTIHAAARDLPDGRSALRIDVIDTGIGIAPEKQEDIFKEFDQAYSDTSRKYGGTGLGLTISKRLAELQGGSIAVRSAKGEGSTFTVEIPYPTATVNVMPAVADATGPEPRELRILLAEDNSFNAMVAQDELVDAFPGVHMDLAVNGKEAVELASANHYDVILMDVQMPEMNGYEATRAIRAMGGYAARTPIIAMTANVMETEVRSGRDAGMDAFVPKPFKREELLDTIRSVLRT